MMDHNSIRHKLSEYIDGTVSAAEKAEIERHLKTCEKCSDALIELKKTIEHIKTIEEIEPPSWMTQKIMAKVRVEAELRKSIYERLYSAFVVNLPVKAVAVVFLTAIAFYMYRDIRPQKLSEAPRQESAVKKEAAPAPATGSGQLATRNYAQPLKRLPQSPEYKALDMKPEYEKPAPPALADKVAAVPPPAKPAEQPMLATKDSAMGKGAVAPQAGAAVMAEEQAVSTAPQASAKLKSAAPARLASKAEAAAKAGPVVILRAKDVEAAAREVEQAITQLGGSLLRKENPEAKKVYTVTISAQKLQDLKAKLRLIGEIEDKTEAPGSQDSMIELRIELEAKSNHPR